MGHCISCTSLAPNNNVAAQNRQNFTQYFTTTTNYGKMTRLGTGTATERSSKRNSGGDGSRRNSISISKSRKRRMNLYNRLILSSNHGGGGAGGNESIKRYSVWLEQQQQKFGPTSWPFARRLSSIPNEELINVIDLPLVIDANRGVAINDNGGGGGGVPPDETTAPPPPKSTIQIETATQFFHTMGFRSVKQLGKGGFGLVLLVEKCVPSINYDGVTDATSSNSPNSTAIGPSKDKDATTENGNFIWTPMACKIIMLSEDKLNKNTSQFQSLRAELYVLKGLAGQCPYVIEYYEHYVIRHWSAAQKCNILVAHIFMEYANAGSLVDEVERVRSLPIPLARRYFAEIVQGLAFLHRNQIAHNDLKLDNVLLVWDSRCNEQQQHLRRHCKLTDFGLSRFAWKDGVGLLYSNKFMGTRHYMAPEVLHCALKDDQRSFPLPNPDHDDGGGGGKNSRRKSAPKQPISYIPFKADIWSLGVTLYVMLTGTFPYRLPKCNNGGGGGGLTAKKYNKWLYELEHKWNIQFRSQIIGKFGSTKLAQLLSGMLMIDPESRYTIGSVECHEWVRKYIKKKS